jgi:hypothetical protein
MKVLASAALATALAVGSVAGITTSASADPYYPYHHHAHYYGYHDDGGGYLAAGILGLATGFVAAQVFAPAPPPPPPPYPYYTVGYGGDDDAHIQWCEATFKSYNPETDLWRDFQGVPHRCQGPY